jgi:hypothetical protein
MPQLDGARITPEIVARQLELMIDAAEAGDLASSRWLIDRFDRQRRDELTAKPARSGVAAAALTPLAHELQRRRTAA